MANQLTEQRVPDDKNPKQRSTTPSEIRFRQVDHPGNLPERQLPRDTAH
jgi:hypothetical protein